MINLTQAETITQILESFCVEKNQESPPLDGVNLNSIDQNSILPDKRTFSVVKTARGFKYKTSRKSSTKVHDVPRDLFIEMISENVNTESFEAIHFHNASRIQDVAA